MEFVKCFSKNDVTRDFHASKGSVASGIATFAISGFTDASGMTSLSNEEAGAPAPDLVIGDFNIPRGSASLATLFPEYQNAFDTAGIGYGATFPAISLYHIDNTLHAPEVPVQQYFISDASLGPHRAQVIDITIDTQSPAD